MQSGGAAIGAPLSPPSFNAYSSSDNLAQIAARVVSELRDELDQAGLDDIDDVYYHHHRDDDVADEEEEFEFACVSRDAAPTSPIAADAAFYNGLIRPVYPVFDQSLLLPNENDDVGAGDKDSEKSAAAVEEEATKPRRRPLGILMSEEERGGETASCSSSSENDELESLPAGTYCVWAPRKAESTSSEKGGKVSSGGGASSRRWRFRDLLYRSSSEGSTKGSLVFLTAKKAEEEKEGGGNVVVVRKVGSEETDGDNKRRSFLPYKQDLVGFFSNVNGLGRNLHPF